MPAAGPFLSMKTLATPISMKALAIWAACTGPITAATRAEPTRAPGNTPATASRSDADDATMPSPRPPRTPGIFSAETERIPRLTLSWTTRDGERVELIAALPYGVDNDRVSLGSNVEAYIAVGGTRIGKNAAHPDGSIVRAGFYKSVGPRAFFEDIRPGSPVEFRLEHLSFNKPAVPQPDTVVMHLKYNPDDLLSCGLPPGAFECFNLRSATDLMNDRTRPGEDTRPGVLAPGHESGAASDAVLEGDGTVTLTASIPYPLFRHLQDPWNSPLPGTFLEPIHFHVEVEVLPTYAEPLDRDAMRREVERIREGFKDLE